MRNSGILLILTVMAVSNLAHATLAECPSCSGNQPDWGVSATAFLEGKHIDDVPSGLNSPQRARLLDAQIDSKKNFGQAPNVANNAVVMPIRNSTPMFNISLTDIHAVPNPANFGNTVKIVAIFGNASSNPQTVAIPNNSSTIADLARMVVYADIKNAAGIGVSRVNLKSSSGNEYAGMWNANLGSGDYKATIDTSGPQGSKIFKDALQIVVSGSKNTTSNIRAIRKLG